MPNSANLPNISYQKRLDAFLLYLKSLDYRTVAQELAVSTDQVEQWAEIDGWDDRIQKQFMILDNERKDLYQGLIFTRLKQQSQALAHLFERIPITEDKELGQIAKLIATLHDGQMTMMGRPTNIVVRKSESHQQIDSNQNISVKEELEGYVGKMPMAELEQLMTALNAEKQDKDGEP